MTANEAIALLSGLTGVTVLTELPAKAPRLPAVFVRDVEFDYTTTFDSSEITAAIVVLVSYANSAKAPRELNDLLDRPALPAQLAALGFSPTAAGEKALYQIGGTTLLGAEITASIEVED